MVVTLCMWKFFFTGGLCSMHESAKRVNIGRNSETENPIGPHFIARSRKKQQWPPYFFIKYWKNMYLAILWCLQYVCRNLFSRNMVQWTWGAFSTFQTIFLPRAGLRAVSKMPPPIGTSASQLPWNHPRIIPWVHTCSKMYTLWYLIAIVWPQNE
jgi:hypothetical protein